MTGPSVIRRLDAARESMPVGIAMAVAAVLVVTLLKLRFAEWIGREAPIAAFLGAIMAVAWFGGTVPGLVATGLSMIAGVYVFSAVDGSASVAARHGAVRLAIEGAEGAVISLLAGQLRRARRAADARSVLLVAQAADLERANADLRRENEARARAERALSDTTHQLRQAQRLASMGQIALGAIHDSNNMLAIVLSYGELLEKRLGAEHPARGYVQELRAAGQRAAGLSARLLAFARHREPSPCALDLNELLRGLEPILRVVLRMRVELVFALEPGVGRIVADAPQIEQVVVNLVANARDAIEGHGTIVISTASVRIGAEAQTAGAPRPGAYVELVVRDDGRGMDDATKARIFRPFFTTKAHGTGLGLAGAASVVEHAGGAIRVESAPGKGTSLRIYWPRADVASSGAEMNDG